MGKAYMSHLIRKVKLFKLTKKTMNILSTYKDLIFGSFMNIRSELLYWSSIFLKVGRLKNWIRWNTAERRLKIIKNIKDYFLVLLNQEMDFLFLFISGLCLDLKIIWYTFGICRLKKLFKSWKDTQVFIF